MHQRSVLTGITLEVTRDKKAAMHIGHMETHLDRQPLLVGSCLHFPASSARIQLLGLKRLAHHEREVGEPGVFVYAL